MPYPMDLIDTSHYTNYYAIDLINTSTTPRRHIIVHYIQTCTTGIKTIVRTWKNQGRQRLLAAQSGNLH